MESFAKELLKTLEAELTRAQQRLNPVDRYYYSLELTIDSIRKLKAYLKKNKFPDQQAEIAYFKTIAPAFYSKSFYFGKLAVLEIERSRSSREGELAMIEKELAEIDGFFSNESHFIWYLNTNADFLDRQFFIRGGKFLPDDDLATIGDPEACSGCFRLARMIGYKAYRAYLEREKDILINPRSPLLSRYAEMKFEFAGTNADATEWIKSFAKEKMIIVNGVPGTGKMLGEIFECVFVRKLGNIDDTHNNNMQRKKDPTPFLNRLIRSLLKKDENF